MADRDPHHAHQVHLLAVAASLDTRSARKALRDGPQSLRGRAGARATLAMRELGLARWVAPAPPLDPPTSTEPSR